MGARKGAALLLAACVLLLAGCTATPPKPAPIVHRQLVTSGGMSAATIASHVKACRGVKAIVLTGDDDPGLESLAKCTIQGHRVVFDAFTAAHEDSFTISSLGDSLPSMWAAHGVGWIAFVADDEGVYLTATDSPNLFAWALAHPNGDGETQDIAAEKYVASAILKDVMGSASQTSVS